VNQVPLDNTLSTALEEMSMANWVQAQKLLAARLEKAGDLGNQRLNLFLLSISAASGGYPEVANRLWAQAQSAPLDFDPVRYLDLQLSPGDPRQSMLIDLEKAWWDFNNWSGSGNGLSLQLERAENAVDWGFVVEATLAGRDADLEARYGRDFDNNAPHSFYLWNLMALAYLQAGDVRTYGEMVQNSPLPPAPNAVPVELCEALQRHHLLAALTVFQKGEWVNNAALFASEETPQATYQTEEVLEEGEWSQQMQEAFTLLGEGLFLRAAREFQEINYRTHDPQRLLLTRNALALTFFKQGDYTQCESVFLEFSDLLNRNPLAPDSPLALDYRAWLQQVECLPEDGGAFFSPFAGNRSQWNPAEPQDLDFWPEFEACVSLLGCGDYATALHKIQRVETGLGPALDSFQSYLTSVLFLSAFVMAGDHNEVQALTSQAIAQEAVADFSSDNLEDIADMLRWAGFEALHHRLLGGPQARSQPLNPWTDLVVAETSGF